MNLFNKNKPKVSKPEQIKEKEKIFRGALTIIYKNIDGEKLFLVVENSKTGNITFVGGAEEKSDKGILETTAWREIKEELNINPDKYILNYTPVTHDFVFGSKKVSRAGCKGCYQVFTADISNIPEINHTTELKGLKWMTANEVLSTLTFEDLKEVFKNIIKTI